MAGEIIPNILIVDDSPDIRDSLNLYLKWQGFRTRVADSANAARRVLQETTVHLIVLDIMMPEEDGLQFCTSLDRKQKIPVIMLTALGEDMDKVRGLDHGADDYLSKPFNPRELVSRINAVLRRVPPVQSAPVEMRRRRFNGMLHDARLRQLVRKDGRQIDLTTGENRLLSALLDNSGQILTRTALLDIVRNRDMKINDRAVDNIVSRLRKKVGDNARSPKLILTEWGGGYRLVANVGYEE